MKPNFKLVAWIPLIIGLSVAAGIKIGSNLSDSKSTTANGAGKIGSIFALISDQYVDDVNVDSIAELSIPDILDKLDPHTVYISSEELQDVNSELEGSFSGIGISFSIMNDTISIVEIISGGPAEKVGLLAGDRIITVNDSIVAGVGISNQGVMKLLRGAKDTVVDLGIQRSTSDQTLKFQLVRGDIPVTSIDAAFLMNDSTGYIKVNKFGRTTYNEFFTSLMQLASNGAKSYIIDLRGNGGGYLDIAILMANEFLPANSPIVFTKGRNDVINQSAFSDGLGSFKNAEVVVLIDEYSASASEILAGAIQDNDRGLIIGRRSFGKGLVQNQIMLPDSSAVRLTVSRYYTPSGRCIQKQYTPGKPDMYTNEILQRYNHGETFHADSVEFNTDLKFSTSTGRTVYGGGGIMPDIFVPTDTTEITGYYIAVMNAGLLNKFAFQYADKNRERLSGCKTASDLLNKLPSDDTLLQSFVAFASQNGIPARWFYINISRNLLITQLKALIGRDIIGASTYYDIISRIDPTVLEAIKALNLGMAKFPIVSGDKEEQPNSTEK